MSNPINRYVRYRKERKHIRETLRLDSQNFW